MSGLGGLISESIADGAFPPHGSTVEPQVDGGVNPPYEDRKKKTNEEEEEEDEVLKKGEDHGDEEEEEAISSALLEPSTLPWPGDKDRRPQTDNSDGAWSERGGSKPEERDTGFSAGSQDMSEKQSEAEGGRKAKAKWRESMPEGDRWRDDEVEPRRDGDGSQADDEYDDEEEEEGGGGGGGGGGESHWMSEKAALGFTPQVTIVHPSGRSPPEESRLFIEKEGEPQVEPDGGAQLHPEWEEQDDQDFPCERGCSVKLLLVLSTVAAALLFPLLVWGGFELLPFEPPLLRSAPLRVVYTLRCSFFAMIPILLGVLVQGVARLRHSEMKPLFQSKLLNREVAVHWHFVNESLALFLFYFLQLAVMASYISQDLLKLVPLLTIMFVFGRLIYWICLSLGSSFRGLGFGFSFFPILVMLGVNLYYICSSVGPESVFDVEPPTTAPPPSLRWWG
ncbi:transmembrane protein 79 isoform X2 [Pleuronectes platessa]|uniref:transmembrane protein 79 isoform X2 n=1 Tax=Pleuronectes platessa TaxID=8262 RepID=UPI00232A142C|nr:transmembrane protein 79 isoform X2 [Pleuronectes platessa]